MSGCAPDVGDVVPDDGAVDVVGAGLEHDLCHGEGLHDPEGFDVGEVVEHEACDGECSIVFESAGSGEVLELAAVGEEGERDDGLEVSGRHRGIEVAGHRVRRGSLRELLERERGIGAGEGDDGDVVAFVAGVAEVAGLVRAVGVFWGDALIAEACKSAILCASEHVEVNEAVVTLFDVAVEKRGVGVEPEFVGDAVHVEPDIGPDFALVGLVVDAVVEDLGPAAGQGPESGGFEFGKNVADAGGTVGLLVDLGDFREVDDFDGSKCFDVEVAAEGAGFLADGADHVGVVGEWEVGVEPADAVHLGSAGLDGAAGLGADVVEVAGVGLGVVLLGVEIAELARECAHVGIVHVAVDVVVGDVAVKPASDAVGEGEDAPDVGGLEQEFPVGEGEPLAGVDFVAECVEALIAPRGVGDGDGGVDHAHSGIRPGGAGCFRKS